MHEKFLCESLRKHAIKIVNFKKKTNEQQESYENAKTCYNCKKNQPKMNNWKIKDIIKLEIIVIVQENIEVLHIAYVI